MTYECFTPTLDNQLLKSAHCVMAVLFEDVVGPDTLLCCGVVLIWIRRQSESLSDVTELPRLSLKLLTLNLAVVVNAT